LENPLEVQRCTLEILLINLTDLSINATACGLKTKGRYLQVQYFQKVKDFFSQVQAVIDIHPFYDRPQNCEGWRDVACITPGTININLCPRFFDDTESSLGCLSRSTSLERLF